jgi:L-lactate dehydrogenase complex protein LldG
MTNPVIDNIRRSLGRSAQTPLSQRPAIYPARQPESAAAEIENFLEEVRKLSGVAEKLKTEDVAEALATLVAEQNIRRATFWPSPFFEQLGLEAALHALDVEIVPPTAGKHELALCDLGITEADYLLPETGTLVLRSSAEKPRAVSLLPRIHLALVQPERLRADLHQVFAECKGEPMARPDYLVFITGPSRTADIELTVTLGVHGPKNLFVWMFAG